MRDGGLLDRWWNEIAGYWEECGEEDSGLSLDAVKFADFEAMLFIWLIGVAVGLSSLTRELAPFSA